MLSYKTKVIIADDHSIFIDGLKMMIGLDSQLEVTGVALTGGELIEKVNVLEPDVIVTDIMMPGITGIDAIKKILETRTIPCIALSTFDSEMLIMEAIEAGAMGYLVKSAGKEIINAIKSVSRGEPYYCKTTEAKILKMMARARPIIKSDTRVTFSQREIEIIKLVSREVSSEDIAKELFASKRTIDGIRSKLLAKMQVKTTAGMVIYALKNNLIGFGDTGGVGSVGLPK